MTYSLEGKIVEVIAPAIVVADLQGQITNKVVLNYNGSPPKERVYNGLITSDFGTHFLLHGYDIAQERTLLEQKFKAQGDTHSIASHLRSLDADGFDGGVLAKLFLEYTNRKTQEGNYDDPDAFTIKQEIVPRLRAYEISQKICLIGNIYHFSKDITQVKII